MTLQQIKKKSDGLLPGHLGIHITEIRGAEVRAELHLNTFHMAPNGFLHAGTVVALADTACGNGCQFNLPKGAFGFTTIELKSNHVGTARQGVIESVANPVHMGRSTQVWDALVRSKESGKTIAFFRCTQMILYEAREKSG